MQVNALFLTDIVINSHTISITIPKKTIRFPHYTIRKRKRLEAYAML